MTDPDTAKARPVQRRRTVAIKVHPIAQLFPPLEGDELAEMAESIRQNGLLVPITRDPDGILLDGVNRLTACEMAGVEPRFETYSGDAVAFILAANIHRRHLNAGQRSMIIAMAYPKAAKTGRGRPSPLSTLESYSASRLSEARQIVKHSRDLALKVIAGETPFREALAAAVMTHTGDHKIRFPQPSSRYVTALEDKVVFTPRPAVQYEVPVQLIPASRPEPALLSLKIVGGSASEPPGDMHRERFVEGLREIEKILAELPAVTVCRSDAPSDAVLAKRLLEVADHATRLARLLQRRAG